MAKVHLANVPRHIGGGKCDLEPCGDAMVVHLVDVVHPDRHPDALVAFFVSVLLKRGGVRAAAAASLRSLTKKDASVLTRSNRAKRRRRSPVPQFFSSPLFKPRDGAGDVGHIQYRSHTFGFHNRSRITLGGARGFGLLEGTRTCQSASMMNLRILLTVSPAGKLKRLFNAGPMNLGTLLLPHAGRSSTPLQLRPCTRRWSGSYGPSLSLAMRFTTILVRAPSSNWTCSPRPS